MGISRLLFWLYLLLVYCLFLVWWFGPPFSAWNISRPWICCLFDLVRIHVNVDIYCLIFTSIVVKCLAWCPLFLLTTACVFQVLPCNWLRDCIWFQSPSLFIRAFDARWCQENVAVEVIHEGLAFLLLFLTCFARCGWALLESHLWSCKRPRTRRLRWGQCDDRDRTTVFLVFNYKLTPSFTVMGPFVHAWACGQDLIQRHCTDLL